MNTESSDEAAKNLARELLKPETCVNCVYQGYRLASFLWVLTAATLSDSAAISPLS